MPVATLPVPWRMSPDAYPVVLPHVSFDDGVLYFGDRPVQPASAEDWASLLRCDGTVPFRVVRERRPASTALPANMVPWLVWLDAAVDPRRVHDGVALLPTVSVSTNGAAAHARDVGRDTRVPSGGAPAGSTGGGNLVFSARAADAWLAMGGRVLALAATGQTHVVTAFGLVGHCVDPLAFRTPGDVSAIARDEVALAARVARASWETWDFPARELRALGRGMRASGEWMRAMLREAILDVVDRVAPSALFVPSAVEPATDEGLLLDLLIELYVSGELGDARLQVYLASPVSVGFRPVDEFLSRFARSFVRLAPRDHDVGGCAERAHAVAEVFRSGTSAATRRVWRESSRRMATIAASRRDTKQEMPVDSSARFVESGWDVDLGGADD